MKNAIGIDLGGTNVKGVLLNELGEVLLTHTIPTRDDGDMKWRENVFQIVAFLKSESSSVVDCIGMSCPGLADVSNKFISFLPNRLSGLENYIWEDYFAQPTFVLNDAHSALIAEASFGAVKGYQNAVLLTLGTGVGGGILINGELHQGQSQMAGHFGHISINTYDDERSIIGMPGSLEYAIGNYSVSRRSLGQYNSTFELVKAYEHFDSFATWLWLDSVRKLAIAIASLSNSLSPEIVVLSGGITQAGDHLMIPLERFLSLYEYRPQNKKTEVKIAKFTDMSGAIGAAAFALTKLK